MSESGMKLCIPSNKVGEAIRSQEVIVELGSTIALPVFCLIRKSILEYE